MKKLGIAGQAQLLTVSALGAFMAMIAYATLQYGSQTHRAEILGGRRTEMRGALEAAIKHAAHLYQGEASCDPITLDRMLARIETDGSLKQGLNRQAVGAFPRRQMQVEINGRPYRVAFGPVRRLGWSGSADPSDPTGYEGRTQDAVVEAWTTFGTQQVRQIAVLINNCTYPCSFRMCKCGTGGVPESCATASCPPAQRIPTEPCLLDADRSIAYHRLENIGIYPVAGWGRACNSGRNLGDLKSLPAASSTIDMRDLAILKNYLRSGDYSGSSSTILIGGGAPETACADLNQDRMVNEMDLALLEKALRGYLHYLPTQAP